MSEQSSLTGPLKKMYEQAGALCFRMQSGKIPIGRRWIHLCDEGTADLLIFPRKGPVTWVECKEPTGSTTKARREQQHAFRERVEAFGHRYIRVTTIDEGMQVLRNYDTDRDYEAAFDEIFGTYKSVFNADLKTLIKRNREDE